MRTVAVILLTALIAFGCGKTKPGNPTEPGPAGQPGSPVTGDLAKVQGKWAVAKLELPPGGIPPGGDKVSDADRQKIEATITGNLLKLNLPTDGSYEWTKYLVLAPEAGKTPAEIDLIDSDKTGTVASRSVPTAKDGKMTTMEAPRFRTLGIYKFEGDTLIVAVPLEPDTTRPAEFKPGTVPVGPVGSREVPVAIVHLKKK